MPAHQTRVSEKPAAGAPFPQEQAADGGFERQEDIFRDWVTGNLTSAHPVAAGRYHLYISLACPWASRTFIERNALGLEQAVGVTVVDPIRDERGWAFRDGPGHSRDPVNGFGFLQEAYEATDPHFAGRVTVPVLWDKQLRRIVNNSEDDICRMLNGVFVPFGSQGTNFFPEELESEHAAMGEWVYECICNGVYRAGFATSQAAYETACRTLFKSLDELEARLAGRRYLVGSRIVDADWRLFCTLIRFDSVYHGHFKCNVRRITDYPNLQGYLMDLYQQPGVARTVDFDHIKRHYYLTHGEINPNRIVPIGPALDLTRPHYRERLSGQRDRMQVRE
jgi:glutathionyl-hydroquinone reductase